MPHVIVKLWPGKTDQQKSQLAGQITDRVTEALGYGAESVSVAFQEVSASRWREDVYLPDIQAKPEQLYKQPGYRMD